MSLGSLTTLFSAPASCTSSYYRDSSGTKFYDGLGPSPTPIECYPSKWVPSSAVYYSPGECPLGWSTAVTAVVGQETRATCCPSGYSITSAAGVFWSSVMSCIQLVTTTQNMVAFSNDNKPVTTEVGDPINAWWAYSIQVRFQATDVPLLSTALPPVTSTSKAIPSHSGTVLPVTTSEASSHSLSNGAIIGIAVGCGVGAFMFLAGVLLLCYSKRKRNRASNPTPVQASAVPPQDEKREETAWPVSGSAAHYSYSSQGGSEHQIYQYPQNPVTLMHPGGHYAYMGDPQELAAGAPTGMSSPVHATELPANAQVNRYHSSPPMSTHSSPSLPQSWGAPSPNLHYQQQQSPPQPPY